MASSPVPSDDSSGFENSVRKRVGKACDRCRLKKSKCDGSKPCSRCKADNQVCLFGERKKSVDKIYPKGYVELLEHQQALLVDALQTSYHRYWDGPQLPEVDGSPLVHNILESLGLLQEDAESTSVSFEGFKFEEDPVKMQASLLRSDGNSRRKQPTSIPTPELSPISSSSGLFSESFSSGSPSTSSEDSSFQNSYQPSSNYGANSQLAGNVFQASQLFQITANGESMKSMDMPFTVCPTNVVPIADYDGMSALSGQFQMAFPDMTDCMEDDTFGNFVDL